MQRVLILLSVAGACAVGGCVEQQAKTAQNSPAKQQPAVQQNGSPKQVDTDKGSVARQDSKADEPAVKLPAVSVAAVDASQKPSANDAKSSGDLPPPEISLEIKGDMSPEEAQRVANSEGKPGDCNQWGGSPLRNNVVSVSVPTEWEVGEFDSETGEWKKETAKNIKWGAALGSQTYGNVVVADGKAFIGTNNGAGYLKR